MNFGPELWVQLLGLVAVGGALYGGIRADLKRLHAQACRAEKIARSTKKHMRRHAAKIGKQCPHKEERGAVPIGWPVDVQLDRRSRQ